MVTETYKKSLILVKFMGWYVNSRGMCRIGDMYSFDMDRHDLYSPRRMQFAWLILQAAYQADFHDCLSDFLFERHWDIFGAHPKAAQAVWLDKIVELIEKEPKMREYTDV